MIDVSEMRKELAEDFPDWTSRVRDLLYDDAYTDMAAWSNKDAKDADVKLVPMYLQDLSLWYRGNYALTGVTAMPDPALLALSTRAAIPGFLFEIPVYDFHPKNLGRYDFDKYGQTLSQILATGWRDQAELVARHGFKELNRLMDRGISYGRLGWFMLELAKDWLKADVSLDSEFREHEVKNLGAYDALLAGWREKAPAKFDALMSEMAEYHLSQSQDPDREDDWFEFEDHGFWLFPAELLAVLRLREWEGIANPPLSHPLFSVTPLATLRPAPDWPKDEILDRAEAKFRDFYPDTPSVADLPALRKEQGNG